VIPLVYEAWATYRTLETIPARRCFLRTADILMRLTDPGKRAFIGGIQAALYRDSSGYPTERQALWVDIYFDQYVKHSIPLPR
jgi:hypothetical protein